MPASLLAVDFGEVGAAKGSLGLSAVGGATGSSFLKEDSGWSVARFAEGTGP